MGTNEYDEDDAGLISYPAQEPILIAADVENDSIVLQEACRRESLFDIR
jgi:hypothetical protein